MANRNFREPQEARGAALPAPTAAKLGEQKKAGALSDDEVLRIFGRSKAIITNSHVVYASGKHGPAYVNKDAVYPDTEDISRLCQAIAGEFAGEEVDVVVGPENGAIILSQWTAHHLTKATGRKILSTYAEKTEGDGFVIKRGYDKLVAGKKILVVEDVLTTGGSVKKVIETVRSIGGNVVGLGVLCNRGGITSQEVGSVPKLFALLNVTLDAYDPEKCPLCAGGVPINTNVGKGADFLAKKKAENLEIK